MFRLLLLFVAGAAALSAQTPLAGPSLGLIFDAKGQALRPVLGIPGAALFGDPVSTPAPVTNAALSLRNNVAIVNDGGWNSLTLSPAGVSNTVPLPGPLTAGARIAVSETGTSAAFYDSVNVVLTTVTGIGTSAMAANPIDLESLPGTITAFAIADDGSLLLSSSQPSGGEALFWLGQDGSTCQLATLQKTASIVLWNSGASALVTDQAANQVWQLQSPGANATITLLASDADGLSSPAGAALSSDGTQLWVANPGNQNVVGITLSTRANLTLACAFHFNTLVPMTDGTSFRLNHLGKGPVWLLDTAPASGPRIVFIPAPQTSAGDSEVAQ